MSRALLRPRWLAFHVLVVAAIVGMISAGRWQLDRLDARQARNAAIEARYDAAPVPIDELLTDELGADEHTAIEWRPVVVRGSYVPESTVRIVNRSQNGRAGDNVVTPLLRADGSLVLVNRGFVPLGAPDDPAIDRPGDDEIVVTGRLRTSEQRGFGQLSDPDEGVITELQRLDVERLAAQLERPVAAMYVELASSEPTATTALEPITAPDLSEGPHRSYAVQWFIFSACVAVGWVLAVRRSLAAQRRSAAVSEATATAP